MKKRILSAMFIFTITVFLPSLGMAFNSGAHVYITEKVFGSDDVDLLYGSIAPDLAIYVPYPETWATAFDDTHYNYIILKPQGWTEQWKRFAIGWMSHNEAWGADWYAHIEYESDIGYVIKKSYGLLQLLGQAPVYPYENIAHSAIEFAIDILIQDSLYPNLGQKLFNAAKNRSGEDVRRLFNILVAKSKVTDRETLYQSEMIFRNLILSYSSALMESSSFKLGPLAQLGSDLASALYGVYIEPTEVESILQIAIYLCENDFNNVLENTIEGIKAELEAGQ